MTNFTVLTDKELIHLLKERDDYKLAIEKFLQDGDKSKLLEVLRRPNEIS
jgi:hypothetical protein